MFKILPHTADVALKISAPTVDALFAEAARGWKALVLADAAVIFSEERQIQLEGQDGEELLVEWLSELNYWLNSQRWVTGSVDAIQVLEKESGWWMTARVSGEALDPTRHHLEMEIKAVTYHQLKVEFVENTYRATIVFDI